jgi:UDP-GlcNAc:undecaprenyl-phosphate GlcNAc-1-phosphate transferase
MNSTIIVYLILTFLILLSFGSVAYKLDLIDAPSKRKFHPKPTAYTGGISISIILLCALFLFDIENKDLNLILSFSFLISLVGFIDDKYNLNVGNKIVLQAIIVSNLIFFQNFFLTNLGDYNYIKLNLGSFGLPVTVLSVLFLINAFNYFDGIDGILSFSSISIFSIIYFLTSDQTVRFFLITLLIPIVIFLFFNFSFLKLPKQFLGDGGSLLLGFITSFLLIYLAKNNIIHPILLAWSISIFVYEFISINLIRLKSKKNLFKPSHDHLHHLFFKITKSITLTNFFIVSLNIFFFIIGYNAFIFFNPITSFLLFIIIFIIFFILRYRYYNQK